MKELEVKILEVNGHRIEEILANLGAKRVFDGEIETLFFDFKDGAIAKAKDVLRLRNEKNKAELTYKTVLGNHEAKVAEEYSVEVSDLESMKKILEHLGLSVIESMQKHRISYSLDRVHFDLDRYTGDYGYIPELLEIEAENIELIHEYAEILGFKAKDCLPWSTNELIHYYSSKKDKT
jgi:predicted adenylyl cyclase CyaB